jgi:hypothetical protein
VNLEQEEIREKELNLRLEAERDIEKKMKPKSIRNMREGAKPLQLE